MPETTRTITVDRDRRRCLGFGHLVARVPDADEGRTILVNGRVPSEADAIERAKAAIESVPDGFPVVVYAPIAVVAAPIDANSGGER